MNDRELKIMLFGIASKSKNTGNHKPDYKELSLPFEEPNGRTVTRSFCTGCGGYIEILPDGYTVLKKGISTDFNLRLENLKYYYIEVSSCLFCSDSLQNPSIKPIL